MSSQDISRVGGTQCNGLRENYTALNTPDSDFRNPPLPCPPSPPFGRLPPQKVGGLRADTLFRHMLVHA